jgi:hypothetical protein
MCFESVMIVYVFSHVNILRKQGSLSSSYFVWRRDWAEQKSVSLVMSVRFSCRHILYHCYSLVYLYKGGLKSGFSRLGAKLDEVLVSGLKRIIKGEIWLMYVALRLNLYEFILVI